MSDLPESRSAVGKLSDTLRKNSFHIVLLTMLVLQIAFLMAIDYFNIESIGVFNTKFYFDLTWKGRMYLLFFVWLFILESIINWEQIEPIQQRNPLRVIIAFVFMLLPIVYIIAVNFFGLSEIVVGSNQFPKLSIDHWALSLEYLALSVFPLLAIMVGYGLKGLKTFPVSLSFIWGITAIYSIDGIYPFGVFKPLQIFSLPTSACTVALLDLLGYRPTFYYIPNLPGGEKGTLPGIRIPGMEHDAFVGWQCAGVHSLLLYTLIMVLFLKKTEFSRARKGVIFLAGAAITYFLNILRIASYCIIAAKDTAAAQTFHDVYGELYFITFVVVYLLVLVSLQSGRKFPSLSSLRSKLVRI